MSQRDFFHPPASEWATYIERGRVTHRLEKDLGLGYVHIGDNLFLFFERKGIKEWDGVRLKRWVENFFQACFVRLSVLGGPAGPSVR